MRASRLNVSVVVKTDAVGAIDPNGGGSLMTGFVRDCKVSGCADSLSEVREVVSKLMCPASDQMIEGWLAELSVITARRLDDGFTESLRLSAYTKRLKDYPADVARSAVLDDVPKFWPTWADLKSKCDALAAARKAMLCALSAPVAPVKELARQRVTPEQAAAIMAEVYGEKSAESE